jgi:hypothetical protein
VGDLQLGLACDLALVRQHILALSAAAASALRQACSFFFDGGQGAPTVGDVQPGRTHSRRAGASTTGVGCVGGWSSLP